MEYGSPESIRQTIHRLGKENILERIAFGIYLKPKIASLLGIVYPGLEEIAKEIRLGLFQREL